MLTLLRETGLDWRSDPVIPFAAENGCRFLQPVAVSGHVDVGVRITKLGNSSVRYEVAIFMPTQDAPSAEGFFVHVFVNRKTGRPTPLPEPVRLHFAQQIPRQCMPVQKMERIWAKGLRLPKVRL